MNLSVLKLVNDDEREIALVANAFNVWVGEAHILKDIHASFFKKEINCIVGPSGSGKSTLIRSINRINDTVIGMHSKGDIVFGQEVITGKKTDVTLLRKKIGMVFQKPCVFPKSIRENVLFGIKHHRSLQKSEGDQIVEDTLRSVSLWGEVCHRLHENAKSLSIGQQQRLCIARTLAVDPEVILLDEPTSSLDPVSTKAVEKLMVELSKKYTIVLVTHNLLQAKRIAHNLIFICDGKIIEQGDKEKLFRQPDHTQTKQYLCDEYCDC